MRGDAGEAHGCPSSNDYDCGHRPSPTMLGESESKQRRRRGRKRRSSPPRTMCFPSTFALQAIAASSILSSILVDTCGSFFCCLPSTNSVLVVATNANPQPFRLEQPDGTETPPIILTGSPHYHQLEDEAGYTVVSDSTDGFLKYGVVDESTGVVVPTEHKMGAIDEESGEIVSPEKLGLEKKAVPTEEAIATLCGQFCIDEQESKEGWEPPVPKKKCRGLLCGLYGSGGSSSSSDNKKVGLLATLGGYNRYLRGSAIIEQNQRQASRQLQAERAKRRRKLAAVINGKLLNVVIPIQFADHPDSSLPSISHIQTLFNAVNGHPTICPTGSIRDVFFLSSYGQLTVVSTVVPWIKLSKPQAYYAGGSSGMAPQFQEALKEALDRLESDPSFSFRDFDANGDGLIDAITYLHSGYGAEWGGVDCTASKAGVGDRIWSHKWKLSPQTWTSSKDGVLVEEYHISPALHGRCGTEMGHIGTIAHELAHFIGLPDLYGGNANSGSGEGNFGLMGNSWGWDSTQDYPPIASPWAKIEMSWLKPQEISDSGRYDLTPSATNPKVMKISKGFPEGEYLLIENRQPLRLDAKMPIGGLVIWHIDELAKHNVAAGYPGSDGWPSNGKHFRVSVVQADGSYGLERGSNRGDAGHIFKPGDELSSNPNTYPSTASYQGGTITGTGIRIFDIKEIQRSGKDTIMRFSLLFDGDTLAPSKSLTQTPTIDAPKPQFVSREILTLMAGGSGSFGNQFDVKAVRDISVTHFDIHSRATPSDPPMEIGVYTKKGTYRGSEYEESAWKKICCDRPIVSAGLAKRTLIPKDAFSESVPIKAGQLQAFYVTATEPLIRYSKARGQIGDIVNGNLDVQVLTGGGVGYYPFGQQAPNRDFNGAIYYDTYAYDVVRPTQLAEPMPAPTPDKVPTSMLSDTKELQTNSFSGNVGSYGVQFDFLSQKATKIKSLSFHTDLTTLTSVQVYFRRGSSVGYERDASAWQLICNTQVLGRGYMKLTPIPEHAFRSQLIEASEIVALYVTLDVPNMRYSKADVGATTGGANADLYIYPGSGVGGYPFGPTIAPRLFDGLLKYEPQEVPTPTPTLEPTIAIPADITQNQLEITTTMSSGNGGYGAMFDVTAKPGRALVVKTIDIHTDALSDVQVQVYVVSGSYAPHSFDAEAWSLICQTTVRGEGYLQRTRLPERDFAKIAIPGGETRGFYVSLKSKQLRYSEVSAVEARRRLPRGDEDIKVGSVWTETRDVQVKVGAGLALDEWSGLFEPRVFNGGLVFACIGDDCEEEDEGTTSRPTRRPSSASPTPYPSLPPTTYPTPYPSIQPAPAPRHVLSTTMAGGSGACGNVFDIKMSENATGSIEITSIDVYTDRVYNITVEVWTQVGSALGPIKFPGPSWTRICRTTVMGAGENKFTPLPPSKFTPVQLSAETRPVRGFLVYAMSPDIRYTPDKEGTYDAIASDANIQISGGDGIISCPFRGPVGTSTVNHRLFNGQVHYTVLA